jgi:hypothetical protein
MEPYQAETTKGPPARPGIPTISMSRETGIEMRRPQYRRQPRFGDKLPGRPAHIAVIEIPKTQRKIDKLCRKYYQILPKLTYGEAMSLCRALRCSYSTYLMRRYGHRRPRLEEIILVVNWYKAGKPTVVTKRKLTIASLFFGK